MLHFVCLSAYAYDFKSKVHCGSALGPGASGLPCYCAPLVCVPDVIGVLTVWRHKKPKTIKLPGWRFVKRTFQKENVSSPPVISRTFKLDEKSKLIKLEVSDKDFRDKKRQFPLRLLPGPFF